MFRKCVLSGDIGFAQSYMDGDWSSPDLVAVIGWFVVNIDLAPTLSGSARARSLALNLMRFRKPPLPCAQAGDPHHGAKEHQRALRPLKRVLLPFLDPSMMYSAARWSRPGLALEEAQREKNERLCAALRLGPDDRGAGNRDRMGRMGPLRRAVARLPGHDGHPFTPSSTNTPRAAWRRPAFPAGWS